MATTTTVRPIPRPPRTSPPAPPALRLFQWATSALVVGILAWLAITRWGTIQHHIPQLGLWFLIVAGVDLAPVPYWGRVCLTMSLPVLVAAGMVYPPWVVGILAFVGSVDPREFRGEVALAVALFNRSQIAVSAMAASMLFHSLGGDVTLWPHVVPVAGAAVAVDAMINVAVVVGTTSRSTGTTIRLALQKLFGGSGWRFAVSYSSFGLLALLLATIFYHAGNWGLVSFLIPCAVARQMFAHGQRLAERSAEVLTKTRALLELSERVADERRDERRRVAASLHDEVLQPLYKVHLLSEVARRDLQSGRLLDLEDDLPQLQQASDVASEQIRQLIKNLRRSTLGTEGLTGTLRLFLDDVSLETDAVIHEELEEITASPLIQLVVYQVAREAVLNASRHSSAAHMWIRLSQYGREIRLLVRDDGIGFCPDSPPSESHFGLELMKERVDSVGGVLHISSGPARGTHVAARFPTHVDLSG